MMRDVERTIRETIKGRNLIKEKGHVVVGLSGGPDSMCLFHVLYGMRRELDIELSAVHLNHKFRPGHAEQDQEFVEKLLKELGVYCYSKTVDVNEAAVLRGETPEEAGRTERYIAFDEEAFRVTRSGMPKDNIFIAVAQNRNDRIETILMRILRGTGSDGLAGIPYKRKSSAGFDIVRPLLDVERKYIEEYCDLHDLDPREDHTNSETNYGRNKVRLDLLPKLKNEYNYNVEEALLKLSKLAASDKDFFESAVTELLKENREFEIDDEGSITGAGIDAGAIKSAHPSVSHRAVIRMLKELGLVQGLESVHIDGAMRIIEKNHTGKIAEFPGGYRMRIDYDKIRFYTEREGHLSEDKGISDIAININANDLTEEKEIVLKAGKIIVKKVDMKVKPRSKNILALDYQELIKADDVLKIRYRKSGDRISQKGMTGTKKVQDLFVDEKISRNEREKIPLLVCGPDILWVAGIRKSYKYSVSDTTKDCLLLEWIPNN